MAQRVIVIIISIYLLLLLCFKFIIQANRRNNHRYLWYKHSLQGTRFKKDSKKNEKSTEAKTIIAKTLLNSVIFKNLFIYEKCKNYS